MGYPYLIDFATLATKRRRQKSTKIKILIQRKSGPHLLSHLPIVFLPSIISLYANFPSRFIAALIAFISCDAIFFFKRSKSMLLAGHMDGKRSNRSNASIAFDIWTELHTWVCEQWAYEYTQFRPALRDRVTLIYRHFGGLPKPCAVKLLVAPS